MVCLDVQGPRLEEAARAAGVRARDAEDQPTHVGLLQPVLRAGGREHNRHHG